MDFKQLEHVIRISESKSISNASESLFITQSALNQQLIRLEGELGVKLFHRSKTGISLTKAGEVFLSYASRLLSLKKECMDVMSDFSEDKVGILRVGLLTVRGYDMFANIFPEFYKMYNHIKLEPLELSVKRQQQLLLKGELDLAFMTLSETDMPELEYIPITTEEIFLAVPADSRIAHENSSDRIDIKKLKNEKFVMIYKDSTLRRIADKCFVESGFRPDILLETSNHLTISNLVTNGYACAVIPKLYISNPSQVRFYHLPGNPSWKLCAAYRKGSYLSKPAHDLLRIAVGYCCAKYS